MSEHSPREPMCRPAPPRGHFATAAVYVLRAEIVLLLLAVLVAAYFPQKLASVLKNDAENHIWLWLCAGPLVLTFWMTFARAWNAFFSVLDALVLALAGSGLVWCGFLSASCSSLGFSMFGLMLPALVFWGACGIVALYFGAAAFVDNVWCRRPPEQA